MIAAHIYEYGEPDVFRVEETADPTPKKGQVLVEVHAAGVNPIDYKMRRGYYRMFVRYKMPRILGLDVSGVVRAVGDGVTRFKVGDEVYSSPSHKPPGTYAELTCIAEGDLARKPANITHAEAAGLPLVFETAWQALVDSARLKEGEHCFIQAGSGGVGSVAIQIAKYRGATVTTTCSARNIELVKGLGADEVIDYTKVDFVDALSGVDVCLDVLGMETMKRTRAVMNKGGRIVGITPNMPKRVDKWGPLFGFVAVGLSIAGMRIGSAFGGPSMRFVTRKPDGQTLEHCTEMVEAGALQPVVDNVFPLAEIADAHRYIETGRARGKVIIGVR